MNLLFRILFLSILPLGLSGQETKSQNNTWDSNRLKVTRGGLVTVVTSEDLKFSARIIKPNTILQTQIRARGK